MYAQTPANAQGWNHIRGISPKIECGRATPRMIVLVCARTHYLALRIRARDRWLRRALHTCGRRGGPGVLPERPVACARPPMDPVTEHFQQVGVAGGMSPLPFGCARLACFSFFANHTCGACSCVHSWTQRARAMSRRRKYGPCGGSRGCLRPSCLRYAQEWVCQLSVSVWMCQCRCVLCTRVSSFLAPVGMRGMPQHGSVQYTHSFRDIHAHLCTRAREGVGRSAGYECRPHRRAT